MRVKSNVKAGGTLVNHNQTATSAGKGLRVKSNVKAGGTSGNHNQTTARGIKVKSNVKASNDGGRIVLNHNQTLVSGR